MTCKTQRRPPAVSALRLFGAYPGPLPRVCEGGRVVVVMRGGAKLVGVVLPRCVTAPNPRNLPDASSASLATCMHPVAVGDIARACACDLSFVCTYCVGLADAPVTGIRAINTLSVNFTPSLSVVFKSAASNREDSRNVFVTICTTFKRKCPHLNPWVGLVRLHSQASGTPGIEPGLRRGRK